MVTPRTLIGTYFAVWDSHTDMEAYDDDTQEVSYLDLALEKPGVAAARHKSSAMETDDGESEENMKNRRKPSVQKAPEEAAGAAVDADADVAFADIWGRFRWWRMLGHFKGMYRPPGAPENVWYFGNVKWEPLGHEPDDSDGEAEMWEDEEVDADTRDAHDFGIAVLGTLDRKGRPFVEMLYNGTGYYTESRRKRAEGTGDGEKVAAAETAMVGDTPTDDVEGARALGIRAFLLDREGRFPDAEARLTDLRELPAALGLVP